MHKSNVEFVKTIAGWDHYQYTAWFWPMDSWWYINCLNLKDFFYHLLNNVFLYIPVELDIYSMSQKKKWFCHEYIRIGLSWTHFTW